MIHRRHSSDQKKEEGLFKIEIMFILWYIFHNFNELTERYPPQLHRQRALIRPKKEKNRVSKSRLMCSFYLNFFSNLLFSHSTNEVIRILHVEFLPEKNSFS